MMTLGEAKGMPGGNGKNRKCEECGKPFEPRDPKHRTCYDCFKRSRDSGSRYGAPRSNFEDPQGHFDQYLDDLKAKGYFNDKGYLRTELLVEDAEWVAKQMVAAKVTMGQLRKFFTMARGMQNRLSIQNDFDALIPEIASFHKHAIAVVGRADKDKKSYMKSLREFIDINSSIARQDQKNFLKGFIPHFESVIAYFTFHNNEEKGD